ncbi:MAG: DUF4340 domain-containing protein [Anaerolineae bacterium]
MNQRATLLTVAVFLLLGAYVLFFELRPADQAPSLPATSPLQVFDVAEKDIVILKVQSGAGQVEFGRDPALNGDWAMRLPEDRPADQVDQVLVNGNATRIGRLRAMRVFTEGIDLPAFGLAEPQLEVTLTLTNRHQLTLLFGGSNPLGSSNYARRGDDATVVYLIDRFVLDDLRRLVTQPPLLSTEPAPITE